MHHLKTTIKKILRNKSILLAISLIIGVIVFLTNLVFGAHFLLEKIEKDASQNIELTLYLKDYTDLRKTEEIEKEIKKLPYVGDVIYISKEDALARLKKRYEKSEEILEQYNLENPLPASIQIITKSPEDQAQVSRYLKQSSFFDDIQEISENKIPQTVQQVTEITKKIRIWIALIFLISMFLVISQAIRITSKPKKENLSEIALEGSIYGGLGVIFGFALLLIFGITIQFQDKSLIEHISKTAWLSIFLAEILLSILIGASCAIISARE